MNSQKRKALVGVILIGGLLTAVASFLAQSPEAKAPSAKPATQTFPEREREQAILHKLTGLLSRAGVQVGPELAAADSQGYLEVHLKWDSAPKTVGGELLSQEQVSPAVVLTEISSISREGTLPRERSLELSADHILVVALDDSETVRWWKLMIDPRLVRAEVGRSDDMRSENLYTRQVDFSLECPDDPQLKQLQLFRPVWDGKSFQLESVGVVPLHRN